MMTIKEFQEWFNDRFTAVLEEKSDAFIADSRDDAVRSLLSHVVTIAQGGKRFRPYLVYVGYTSEGGEEDIFLLCAAMELFHLFCLIHDDVIDNEPTRHDTATVQHHVQEMYDNEAIGRAAAILIGDLVLVWAYECLQEMQAIEPYTIDEASVAFRTAVTEVIHGQLLDVFSVMEADQTKEKIENKMELKSARYSFFHPLYIGMLLAGADEDKQLFAEEYAVNLGMAFQLQDDIADRNNDVRKGLQTQISWYMRNLATPSELQAYEVYSGQEWSSEEEQKLQNILQSSGALTWAEQKAEEYYLRAEDAIFNHDRTGEEIWQELVQDVRKV